MEHSFWDILLLHEAESAIERQVALWLDRTIAKGFLDSETVSQAKEQLRDWYKDPRAFIYWILVLAAGRA